MGPERSSLTNARKGRYNGDVRNKIGNTSPERSDMYYVGHEVGDNKFGVVAYAETIDEAVTQFRKESLKDEVLTMITYLIVDETGKVYGGLSWGYHERQDKPFLLVSLENRNVSLLYNTDGSLANQRALMKG